MMRQNSPPFKKVFRTENYEIDEAENGDEAIQKGLQTDYDLILLI